VALLVIDATVGVTHQDQRLAERIDAAGCPIVIVLNKWELLDTEQKAAVSYDIGQKLAFLGESVVIRISALTGKNVHRLLPTLSTTIEGYHKRVPTRRVNDVVFTAQSAQPAPHGARILYATQGATDPPTFTLFANKELPATYLRYIERKLREEFELGATPIKLRVRHRAS
jgi:GTP-binding protein